MSLNEILIDSRERTGLKRKECNDFKDIFISLFASMEGFIIQNRSDKANKIDRIITYILEGILSFFISLFVTGAFILSIEIYVKNFLRLYPNYHPITQIGNYFLLTSLAISVFFIAIMKQRSDSNFNIVTPIKTLLLIIRVSKNKIAIKFLEFVIHIFILIFWVILFYFAILMISISCVPIQEIGYNGYVFIGALACTITYLFKVELEKRENKKILTKSIFVISSYILVISLSFVDLNKLQGNNTAWVLKMISILFLFIFQTVNIIPLAKDIVRLTIKTIEESTKKCTEMYLKKGDINDIIVENSIECYLLTIYNFIPTHNYGTVTDIMNNVKLIYKENLKSNREKVVSKRNIVIKTIMSFAVIALLMIVFKFNEYNYYSTTITICLIFITYIILIICFGLLEGKTVKEVIASEISYHKTKLFPKHELSNDLQKFKSLYFSYRIILTQFIFLFSIATISIILSRTMLLFHIRITQYITLIYFVIIMLFYTIISNNIDVFNVYYRKFEPSHIKYRIIKILLRISLITFFFFSIIIGVFIMK